MVVFHKDALGITTTIGVHLLLIYGNYSVVYYVIEYGQQQSFWRTVGALLMHFFFIMAVVSHVRAMFSNPGYVPLEGSKVDFSSDLEKADHKQKKKKEPPAIDEWTLCNKCETYRPPRSHHCRKCGRCVRRMDHHCPWINNCVGELNLKYFFLFLFYTGLMCLFGLILIISDWVKNWGDDEGDTADRVITLIAFFESVIFGIFVSGIGLGLTIAVLCDRNAIEIHRYGHPMGFPKTPKMILVQALCGRGSKLLWLIPCVKPRIPDPVPPSKLALINMMQSV